MIPKIIHYCWFGRNPKPKLAEKCIKSWKKYCKDYEIIEWNEDNFNISEAPLYVRQAYEEKKWAFVTDYVRLYAMVNYGGVYMDTDVEVVKPLDEYLVHEAFSGFESEVNIPTGIMASEKKFPLFNELLHYYDNIQFVKEDGSLDLTTNVEIITNICKAKGFEPNGKFQIVEGFALYPKEVFCPGGACSLKVKPTPETVTIHWYAGSWLDEKTRAEKEEWIVVQRKNKKKELRKKIRRMPRQIVKALIGKDFYDKIKSIFIK